MINMRKIVVLMLFIAFFTTYGYTAEKTSQKLKTYTNEDFGVKFDYPDDWEIVRFKDNKTKLLIQPYNWKEMEEEEAIKNLYIMHVEFCNLDLEEAALEKSGFENVGEGKWQTLGKDMKGPAEEIKSDTWIGVRGAIETGCYNPEGGYRGLSKSPSAVLNDRGNRSVVFNGCSQSGDVLEIIINSFEFFPLKTEKIK